MDPKRFQELGVQLLYNILLLSIAYRYTYLLFGKKIISFIEYNVSIYHVECTHYMYSSKYNIVRG